MGLLVCKRCPVLCLCYFLSGPREKEQIKNEWQGSFFLSGQKPMRAKEKQGQRSPWWCGRPGLAGCLSGSKDSSIPRWSLAQELNRIQQLNHTCSGPDSAHISDPHSTSGESIVSVLMLKCHGFNSQCVHTLLTKSIQLLFYAHLIQSKIVFVF